MAEGEVRQVIGTVVDVQFPQGQRPGGVNAGEMGWGGGKRGGGKPRALSGAGDGG